jgi:GNAT superfamily N-acetyltransferase
VDLFWSAVYSGPIALLINEAARISRHRINSLPDVAVVVVVIRSADAIARGKRSYQYHRSMIAGLPPTATRRWCIDYLAALPAGRGHGGRLLDTFLTRADTSTVEIVLHCATQNLAFYQRHGFHRICTSPDGDQHIMTRPPRMPGRPPHSEALDSRSLGSRRRDIDRRVTPRGKGARPRYSCRRDGVPVNVAGGPVGDDG